MKDSYKFSVILKIILITSINIVLAFSLQFVSPDSYRDFDSKKHDVNQVELYITNFGKIGQLNNWIGGWWPKGSGHNYMFGAGSWFGTIDHNMGDTLVTIGYSTYDGSSEFVPGTEDVSLEDPHAVIYMYPTYWPPPVSVFPMAPEKSISYQDSWCAYNDLDPDYHHPGDTRPIEIEVYQTIYAWGTRYIEDIIFIKYEFKNVSDAPLTDCYFGVVTDNDIGDEAGNSNDIMAGIVGRWYVIDGESLWVDNLSYQWQEEPESGWTEFPGIIGYDFLQTAWDLVENADKDNDGILDQYERDSAYFYNHLPDSLWDTDYDDVPDWRDPSEIPQIGMAALKRFYLGYQPSNDKERYRTLAGYNYETGVYEPWDTTASVPADQRYLQCSGPFDLGIDSVMTMVIGIVFADWYNIYQTPDSAIVEKASRAQLTFDKNWLLPYPPQPPSLICIPGDAKITLVWDNDAEAEPDLYFNIVSHPGTPLYNPFYRQYDFEGYRIWKQSGEDWLLLTQCDLYNGIAFEDTTEPESIRIKATESGITHMFEDYDVRNGFSYSYAVTAFDYNRILETYDSIFVSDSIWYAPESLWIYIYDTLEVTGPRARALESGILAVQATPRRDPANLVTGLCSLNIIYGNSLLINNISTNIVNQFDMTETPFFLEFNIVKYDSINGKSIYTFYLKDSTSFIVDSMHTVVGNENIAITDIFSPFHGIAASINFEKDMIPTDQSIFDDIEVMVGTYPESLLTPSLPGPWASYFTFWSYRGNDYDIHWISTVGSNTANSVIVIDLMSGDTIEYRAYDPDMNHAFDSLANGWCFLSHLEVSDTLVLYGSPPATRNTKYLYINGGLVGLKGGGFLQPGDVLPQTGDIWQVHANTRFLPVPVNARFRISSSPAYFDTVNSQTLNVKIVPNPYLMHNEWQQRFSQRKIRFINLPADCTIRIFTLNGELIKTIKHHHAFVPVKGQPEVPNSAGGDEWWNLLSETRHIVESGVYIFHVQSAIGHQTGKFVIIR